MPYVNVESIAACVLENEAKFTSQFAAMEELNSNFWNQRYLDQETGWDAGEITTPLKTYIDQLSDKSINILIPGCGNAHEASYLHQQGFTNTHLVDYAQLAIDSFLKRHPNFPASNAHCEDFFEHTGAYNLILEQTFFCAIDPNLRSHYAAQMARLLKSGGKLAGVLFIDPFTGEGPPFGGSVEEYKERFEEHFHIQTMEPCYNSIEPRSGREVFIILEKP